MLCTDGSDLAERALGSAVGLLPADAPHVIVTVMDEPDPMAVTGTGFAGGTMSAEEFDRVHAEARERAHEIVGHARDVLGLQGSDTVVLRGAPGPAICGHAAEIGARVVVVGSRGLGGLKRAVLGSVSDHVIRHAPCPVLVVGDETLDGG